MQHFSQVNNEVFSKVKTLLEEVEATPKKPQGVETWFFRSDTGTGKSQGYIQHIVGSESSYAIALPTNKMVKEIHDCLVSYGVDSGYWYSGCGHDKPKDTRVFVGTHKYLLSDSKPENQIGKKDVLIIDETPKEYKGGMLTVSDFRKAEELAISYLPLEYQKRFTELSQWAAKRYDHFKDHKDTNRYEPQEYAADFGDLKKVREATKAIPDADNKALVRKVLDFLVAAGETRAFYRLKGTKTNAALDWCFYDFRSRGFKRQVVFSATCNLDGFQHSPDGYKLRDSDGARVDYSGMDLMKAPWPWKSKRVVSTMTMQESQEFLEYIDSLLGACNRGLGEKFLLVLPKRLRSDLEFTMKQKFKALEGTWDEATGTFFKEGNQVFLTNWGADVGSNDYRECGTVILFHNNYLPTQALMSDYLHFAELNSGAIRHHVKADGNLGEVVRGYQSELCEGGLKQMAMRGSGRNIQDDGTCGKTRVVVAWFDMNEDRAQKVFPNCNYREIPPTHPRFAPKPKSKIVIKAAEQLASFMGDEIALSEVLGRSDVSRAGSAIAKESVYLGSVGWKLVKGERGRYGKPSKFVRIEPKLFKAA